MINHVIRRKSSLPVDISGSKPLKVAIHERYCRYRAQALPRIEAWRKSGHIASTDNTANVNSLRLEKSMFIQARIGYLTRKAEDLIAAKRARIEEQLWAIHEASISDYFEEKEIKVTNADNEVINETRAIPRLITQLSPEMARQIEDVQVDSKGRLVPKLYSKIKAMQELRQLLDFGKPSAQRDVTQLSDAELVKQLAQQAKELGVEIDLSYTFKDKEKPDEEG
jgi:hypothetical protein